MPPTALRHALSMMALLLVCWALPAHALGAERKVLLLYSLGGNAASQWQSLLDKGISAELTSQAGAGTVAIYQEHFDSIRLDEADTLPSMAPYLRAKYAQVAFDAIVSENYLASRFLSANPDLFPGVPRFHVNHQRGGWRPAEGTGLGIDFDYARALAAIPLTLPDVRRIVIIADRDPRGVVWTNGMRPLIANYRGRIEIEIWDDLTFAQLRRRVAGLGTGTAIYLFPVYRDAAGARTSPAAITRNLASLARVPIFTYVDSLIVPGVAGGYAISGEAVGRAMGRIAAGKPADLDRVQEYIFDYGTARRFGLAPVPGTQWRNKPQDVWEQYRWQIIAGLGLMALEAVLITALVFALRGRRQSVRALREERHKLEERVALRTHELQAANAALEALATTDALTGIGNRRKMTGQISAEIERARRFKHPLALLMIDIDHFKRVNDRHGHDAGDRAIVAVAHALTTEMRSIDLAARFGGEEFVVLMPETGLARAAAIAERLRAAIAALAIDAGDGAAIRLTISIGVAATDPQATFETPSTLLSRADRALYRAKAEGRDQVACG